MFGRGMGKKKSQEGEQTSPADEAVLEELDPALGLTDDESVDVTEGEPLPEPVEEELHTLQEQLDEANDRYLRLAAEFDNFKKRMAREQTESRARAQGDVVRQLLEALDDLERVVGLEESDATVHDVVTGVHMVERKLQQELEVLGTERVAHEGDVFDPNFHEAIGALPVPQDKEAGTIASVVQRGYKLGTTLLRAAKVLVYVAPEPDEADDPSEKA